MAIFNTLSFNTVVHGFSELPICKFSLIHNTIMKNNNKLVLFYLLVF